MDACEYRTGQLNCTKEKNTRKLMKKEKKINHHCFYFQHFKLIFFSFVYS